MTKEERDREEGQKVGKKELLDGKIRTYGNQYLDTLLIKS